MRITPLRATSGRQFTPVIDAEVPISLARPHEEGPGEGFRENALVGGVSSADAEVREQQSVDL